MKKYIRANTSLDGFDEDLMVFIDSKISGPCKVDGEGGEAAYELDPDFFDTFCTRMSGFFTLAEQDRRKVAELKIWFRNYREKGFRVRRNYPITEDKLADMVDDLKTQVLEYLNGLKRIKQENAELKSQGLKKMSPAAYMHYIMKKELGISYSFYYSDTRKTLYMLYDLPFTDDAKRVVYMDEYKEFKDKFLAILDRLESDYGLIYETDLPSGGNYVRSAWQVWSSDGPNVIVDRDGNVVAIDE